MHILSGYKGGQLIEDVADLGESKSIKRMLRRKKVTYVTDG